MSRYTGPKNRLARREGIDLGLKTSGSKAHASLLRRLNVPPGQHGPKGSRRKPSDYSFQLREKQKAKRFYGIGEKQFRNYYLKAVKIKGNTGEHLLTYLESRLDNIVYRLNLAPTRTMARQLTSHRHVLVNDKILSIPSYQVKAGDVISLKPKSMNIPAVKKLIDEKNLLTPKWLERKGPVGKMVRLPERTEIDLEVNEQLIVEFYSR
ncbi:MAG: 30S ribosomal protein S4 [Candidatus Gottesmanbacteria bacterium GW2011_GWA1_34_13]|uniref:Small ribosomal subunit protein uS4 n=1 Tax=Candidatus Gottesmanbacteria bacterium GW2011_GWA1_34_13 TaxID=1618434 RepID=A0A0G0D941_9BACT|nr:MAG: 30S ribosomal protein S4 [Candidatus Gottesmanbacteria bacterium GW2011_GWA1_34_13]